MQYHYWTVLKDGPTTKHGRAQKLCRCKCGEVRFVGYSDLKNGRSKSCGCYQKEIVVVTHTTHGHTGSTTYYVWAAMWDRCTNKNNVYYHNYGGRGITVDPHWGLFENFRADMGLQPEGLQLDRIDNDKGYRKDNCRWTTRSENCRNLRKTLTYKGRKMTQEEISKEMGISSVTLRNRIKEFPNMDLETIAYL